MGAIRWFVQLVGFSALVLAVMGTIWVVMHALVPVVEFMFGG